MVPVFFGAGVFQVNFFVDTIFAASSRMPRGQHQFAVRGGPRDGAGAGSYAIALSTAMLPTMSHQAADGKHDEMKHTFGFALRVVSFITIPAAVGLILLRVPIMQVLFQHGEFMARIHRAHGPRAAVLFAGIAGVRGHQADHADVLLDARYAHAGESGRIRAGPARSAEYHPALTSGDTCGTPARRWPARSRPILISLRYF